MINLDFNFLFLLFIVEKLRNIYNFDLFKEVLLIYKLR